MSALSVQSYAQADTCTNLPAGFAVSYSDFISLSTTKAASVH